nr:unnamed protein product [Callosobruchus chinensis]
MLLALDVNELHMKITGHMALIWAVSIGCIGNQLLSMYKPLGAVLYLLGYSMGLTCFVIPGQKLQMEDFNRVFKDLTETKRFGKPTTFDTEVNRKLRTSCTVCQYIQYGYLLNLAHL